MNLSSSVDLEKKSAFELAVDLGYKEKKVSKMHRKSSKIQKVPLDSNLLMKKNHPISDYNIFHLTTSTGMNTSPKQSGAQSRWITDFESCPNSQLLCANSLSHYQFPLPHKPEEKWRQACHHRSNHILTQV